MGNKEKTGTIKIEDNKLLFVAEDKDIEIKKDMITEFGLGGEDEKAEYEMKLVFRDPSDKQEYTCQTNIPAEDGKELANFIKKMYDGTDRKN